MDPGEVILELIGVDNATLREAGLRPEGCVTRGHVDDRQTACQIVLVRNRVPDGVSTEFHCQTTVIDASFVHYVAAEGPRPVHAGLEANARDADGIAGPTVAVGIRIVFRLAEKAPVDAVLGSLVVHPGHPVVYLNRSGQRALNPSKLNRGKRESTSIRASNARNGLHG